VRRSRTIACASCVSPIEVSRCSLGDWEKAILTGYDVWRQVEKNHHGKVVVDLDARSITYQRGVS
jgi:ribosomal protein L18